MSNRASWRARRGGRPASARSMMASTSSHSSGPSRPASGIIAVATTIIPEAGRLGPDEWEDVEAIIDRALAGRPPRLARQLALLLIVLEWLPLPRYGRRLSRLHPARRLAFLER